METSTSGSVEHHDHGNDRIADSDAQEGLAPLAVSTPAQQWTKWDAPRQTDCKHRASKLPYWDCSGIR